MTEASSGYGTLLKMGDGVTPTEGFTTIAEVKDISGPGLSSETIDVTNQSSPGAVREFIASLLDAGEVTFSVNFIGGATQDHSTGLIKKWLDRARTNFKLDWPNGYGCDISALVTGFEPSAPVEDALTADVTLKVSGLPTFRTTP